MKYRIRNLDSDVPSCSACFLCFPTFSFHTRFGFCEKIAAPKGKHDDYCDSAVLGIHGSLSMLPGEANFSNVTISARNPRARANANHFASTRRRNNRSMHFKRAPRGF